MPNEQIINYIRTQLQSGATLESVKISLLQSGWKQQDVDTAIWHAQQPIAPVIPVQPVVIQPQIVQTPIVQQPQQVQTVSEQAPTPQIPPELKTFVEGKLNAGLSKISIAASLKIAGWDENLINLALGELSSVVNHSQNSQGSGLETPTPPKKVEVKSKKKKSKCEKPATIIDYKIDITENFILAVNVFKENFLAIVGIQILPTILSIFVTSFFSIIGSFDNLVVALSVATISIFLFFILGIWAQTALLYAITNRERNVLKSYGRSFKRAFPLLITVISLAGVMISGTALFIIPAIIFSIWFAFAPFITVSEKLKGAKALAKSRNYVKGNFWTVFARAFLIGIITIILLLILNSVTNLLFPEPSALKILWAIPQSAIQLIVTTFALVFMYVLFESIKNTKKDLKETKSSFVWLIRILTWLGCGGIIAILGIGAYLVGNALWDVFQELSATGELSMETVEKVFGLMQN